MRKPTLVLTAAVAGLLALAGCGAGTATGAGPSNPGTAGTPTTAAASTTGAAPAGQAGTISAQGVGQASGTPDTVTLSIGVETKASSARAAMADNAAKANALIAVLKQNGVADKDLQTSQLSVSQMYSNDGRTVTGYQVDNMVTAKISGVAKAGTLVDLAGKSAGDAIRMQGLSFSFSDDSKIMATARADAVRQAQTQAKQLADAAGVKLGAVRSIVEQPAGGNTYPMALAASAAAAPGAPPIQAGSVDLSVTVQVVYEIAH